MGRKKSLLFLILSIASVLALAALPAIADQKQDVEGIVATVNDAVITQAEFDLEMSRVQERFRQSGRLPNQQELARVKEVILDNLIARELLYQESKKKGFKGSEDEVNQQLETLKARFSSEEEFQTALTKMNITKDDLRSQIQEDITIGQFIRDTFVQKVAISDNEVKAYYDNNTGEFEKPEEIRARHILLDTEEEAAELLRDIKKGADFVSMAREHSTGPTGETGGDLGYFSRGRMVAEFGEAAFALEKGQISDVVKTAFG